MTFFDPKKAVKDSHQELLDDCKRLLEKDRVVTRNVPEHIFVNTFLPMFFAGGIHVEEDGTKIYLPLTAWIERYAGNVYNEVNVIGPNGDILYVVPPMTISAGTYQSHLATANTVGINGAFSEAAIAVQNESDPNAEKMTALGEKYLGDIRQTTDDLRNEVRNRWLAIYSRYGLIPEQKEVVKTNDNDDQFTGEAELL